MGHDDEEGKEQGDEGKEGKGKDTEDATLTAVARDICSVVNLICNDVVHHRYTSFISLPLVLSPLSFYPVLRQAINNRQDSAWLALCQYSSCLFPLHFCSLSKRAWSECPVRPFRERLTQLEQC